MTVWMFVSCRENPEGPELWDPQDHSLTRTLLIDGAAWGVLEVDSSVRRDFSQDTVEFLQAAAAIIGAAVQRDQAYRNEATAVVEASTESQRRDVLLKELQHRVKNNFQIILASISIQKRRSKDSEVQQVLDHVAVRITAISLAHDQLAPRDNIHAVNVATYLRALCASIEQQVDNIAVELHSDASPAPTSSTLRRRTDQARG